MTTLRLDQFAGTHVEGAITVSAAALNELLGTGASPLHGATLDVMPGNQLVVRYGVLHATATLPAAIDTGASPRITVTLASLLVAMGLKAALRQPYVEVSGRRLTICLADVPPLQSIRELWPYVRRVELSTDRGAVRAHFVFSMSEVIDA